MSYHIMRERIKLDQTWFLRQPLCSGGFGTIYLAESCDHVPAVVKLVPKVPGASRELLFADLKDVPNVVPIIDQGELEDCFALVMPKADKSLRNELEERGRLSTDDAVRLFVDVTKALVSLVGKVVHRDVKPENILLLNGHWCLADFGISRYADASTAQDTRKLALSPPYAAPEQWRAEHASSATDVYALGVVLYESLTGGLPFRGPDTHDFRRQHLEDVPKPISTIPEKLQALIDECLIKSPEARPNPNRILTQLEKGIHASSNSAQRLQQANIQSVRKHAESARQESIAKLESQRRNELLEAAHRSMQRIVGLLHDEVIQNAPTSIHSGQSPNLSWTLNEATLKVDQLNIMEQKFITESSIIPFAVATCSRIAVQVKTNRYGYEGRSHSLWFCDAKDQGEFRWYETAFMVNPAISDRRSIEPFALDPWEDAARALSIGMHSCQVAWGFNPIDQGDETAFIERWIGWFADAAQGQLRRPRHMPEHDTRGTWRRERLQ